MKKIIFIVIGVIVLILIALAILGYFITKQEVTEITPQFEELYKEVFLVYETDTTKGIAALEDAMYYGHSHGLIAYRDPIITRYNEHYKEGLNILTKHYREQGKKLEDEGKLDEALETYKKIFTYTDQDESLAYQKGTDVDLLFMDIKKLEEKIR